MNLAIQISRQSSSQLTQLSRAPEHHFDKAAIVPSVTIVDHKKYFPRSYKILTAAD